MNVRKLMGRLNAATCRFDIGRGGIPDLTPQDIAAALAMVEDPFAREVFCAVWWPDGAKLTRDNLLRLVALKQRQEIERQMRKVQVARLELHIVNDEISARRNLTDEMRRERDRAERRLADAKRASWPQDSAMYHTIRVAALEELAAPNLCKTCNGIGVAQAGDLKIACVTCGGHGTVPVSDLQRSLRIGRDHRNYDRTWKAAYEWTFSALRDAESVAAQTVEEWLHREAA
jgi:hypothetical protein